jgi:hypothetical protein
MTRLSRRSFGFALAGIAGAAVSPSQPLSLGLGAERVVARGVPRPYLVQLSDGTTILLGHVRWPKGGRYPIHYTAVSRDGRKTPPCDKSRMDVTTSQPLACTVSVAPSFRAVANFCGMVSTAIIDCAPARQAPSTALRPTLPIQIPLRSIRVPRARS